MRGALAALRRTLVTAFFVDELSTEASSQLWTYARAAGVCIDPVAHVRNRLIDTRIRSTYYVTVATLARHGR